MTGLSIPTLVRALWLAEQRAADACIARGLFTDMRESEGIAVDNDRWALMYQRNKQRAGRIGKALFEKLGVTNDPAHQAFMQSWYFDWDSHHCTGPDWERDKRYATEE
jgi:hypothetical protein